MKKLVSVSGNGFSDSSKKGKFEVRYQNSSSSFTELNKAREFYELLNVPSAIWDLTELPELLDLKEYF